MVEVQLPSPFSVEVDALYRRAGVRTGNTNTFSGHLRFALQIRYTRWNNDAINLSGSHGYQVKASKNQADILIGIFGR